MPVYEFESKDGRRIERLFPASDVPQKLTEDGVEFRKVLSACAIVVPDQFKATYWSDRRVGATLANNEEIATRIANDPDQHPVQFGDQAPDWVKSDLNNRIAAKKGRTRLG